MSEQLMKGNGIDICTESFGISTDPAVLLIMGATASMIWWEGDFCQRLADRGRYVIRYDNRDVGRSVVYESGHPEYTFEDMPDDAIHVILWINESNLRMISKLLIFEVFIRDIMEFRERFFKQILGSITRYVKKKTSMTICFSKM